MSPECMDHVTWRVPQSIQVDGSRLIVSLFHVEQLTTHPRSRSGPESITLTGKTVDWF